MTVHHNKFAASDPTEAEMLAILESRVERVYHMTLNDYAKARRDGKLPEVPGAAALEVFAGDYGRATRDEAARAKRIGR